MRTVVELGSFRKDALRLMGHELLDEFLLGLARDPTAGSLVADTGGFRKVRGPRKGVGRRGGVRVFYLLVPKGPLVLVSCVAKADDAPMSGALRGELRWLAASIRRDMSG